MSTLKKFWEEHSWRDLLVALSAFLVAVWATFHPGGIVGPHNLNELLTGSILIGCAASFLLPLSRKGFPSVGVWFLSVLYWAILLFASAGAGMAIFS
ncbi:hypothetical protein HQ571_04600 [Candidatus Kuenenbacteria bacterium]|nr:hypothetical protein [Candidatus Kuenenbacteria bacterium]